VAKEAWMLRLMDVERFRHIRAVLNLPSGRALLREEIRALFAVCAGPRPWGWICLTLSHKTERCKGNKGRLAYVPAEAQYRLQIWVEAVRGETPGPLFTRIRRFGDVTLNRLTDQGVYHILQVSQSHAGIGKCSPHDLRRTFATAMLDNEEDLITVKDAMGHASVTTTQQYDRRGEQRLQDARDRLSLI